MSKQEDRIVIRVRRATKLRLKVHAADVALKVGAQASVDALADELLTDALDSLGVPSRGSKRT